MLIHVLVISHLDYISYSICHGASEGSPECLVSKQPDSSSPFIIMARCSCLSLQFFPSSKQRSELTLQPDPCASLLYLWMFGRPITQNTLQPLIKINALLCSDATLVE